MLPGFPKKITTVKLNRGHYRIDREDGYSIEVRRSAKGYWYQTSNLTKSKSLSVFEYDMKNGYMSYDQLNYSDTSQNHDV